MKILFFAKIIFIMKFGHNDGFKEYGGDSGGQAPRHGTVEPGLSLIARDTSFERWRTDIDRIPPVMDER
ncbi:hypothetical protein [Burkholderia sp. 22PA0106]|uniref:hypothetical protein n=1 Tax=Burkholderia sp. 22PA0106 TaxID=3237371 RepID=UPI0039C3A6F1